MHWFDVLLRTWERDHPGEHLSIRRLAGRAGLDKTTIQRFKRGGSVTTVQLIAIAAVLDMTPGDLLDVQCCTTVIGSGRSV